MKPYARRGKRARVRADAILGSSAKFRKVPRVPAHSRGVYNFHESYIFKIVTFNDFSKSIIEKISDKLGILVNLTVEFVRSVEARIGSAEFFDPLILIFPLRGFPPNISITSIL